MLTYSVRYEMDQRRFLIVLGDAADDLADDSEIKLLDRLDHVTLVETTYWTSIQIQHRSGVMSYSYEREADARRVLALFDNHPTTASRDFR